MELLFLLIGLCLGFGGGWLFFSQRNDPAPLSSPGAYAPKARCGTVTYFYSDGSQKTFHNCEGFTDFGLAFGRAQAPKGATLLRRQGGTHR